MGRPTGRCAGAQPSSPPLVRACRAVRHRVLAGDLEERAYGSSGIPYSAITTVKASTRRGAKCAEVTRSRELPRPTRELTEQHGGHDRHLLLAGRSGQTWRQCVRAHERGSVRERGA